MKKLTYDKSSWKKGPWDNEPDRVDFIHAGFACFILRNRLGTWCGYVGVPNTHPAYAKDYTDMDVDVHGGLTYADVCSDHICHVPEAGMPDDVWWLGFDTGHSWDLCPSQYIPNFTEGATYKDVEFATSETKKLAEQLKDYNANNG